MSSQPPDPDSPVLNYAKPTPKGPKQKGLKEIVGIHFVIGAGSALLIGSLWNLSGHPQDYLWILSCEGVPIIIIQWLLLSLPVYIRRRLRQSWFDERGPLITILVGLMSIVFSAGISAIAEKYIQADLGIILINLLSLLVYPLLASFIVYRRVDQSKVKNAIPLPQEQAIAEDAKIAPPKSPSWPNLGTFFAHASWGLPILSFGCMIAYTSTMRQDPSTAFRIVCAGMIAAGACCGAIALIGIFRWGHRDWSFAAFGLAICTFIILLAFFGGP